MHYTCTIYTLQCMHCTYCYCIQLRIVTLSARVLQAVQTLPGTAQLLQLWVLAAFFSPAVSKQLTATAVSGWNAIEIIKKYSKTLFSIRSELKFMEKRQKSQDHWNSLFTFTFLSLFCVLTAVFFWLIYLELRWNKPQLVL